MTIDSRTDLRAGARGSAYAAVRARLAPVLAQAAAGALQRELDDELPHAVVDALKQAGVGAVRVPVDHGGDGLDWVDLTRLWIDLAAADANLAQALRGHYALAEDRLWQHARGRDQSVWFERFVRGEIAGNAWSEGGAARPAGEETPIETQATVLTPDPQEAGAYRLDGAKYYTTGTAFAEWADVYARLAPDPGAAGDQEPRFVIALVRTDQAGVTVFDDWDGFGQRGTGSGTARFDGARVAAVDVVPFEERFGYQTAVYQLSLLATLAGIARTAHDEVVEAVRTRTRTYSHANAPRVRDDPQVLARVGELGSAAYVAEAATLEVARAVQAAYETHDRPAAEVAAALERAELASSAAQVVITELVLRATSDLFDTLGASGTARSRGLDRHWRNARTVSSHNPRILKARVVGAHAVNGTPPPYAWAIGSTQRDQSWSTR